MNIEHSEVTYPNFERVKARIAAGEIIVYGRPDLLLIDLDSEDAFTEFKNRREFTQNVIPELNYHHRKSPSGRGYHVYIQVKGGLRIRTRLAMQAMLGSDYKRDLLSLNMVLDKSYEAEEDGEFNDSDFEKNPIFLFEKGGIETLPDWIITKQDVKKQRAAWVVAQAKGYGLEATVTIPPPPVPKTPVPVVSRAREAWDPPVADAPILAPVDRSRAAC